MDEKMVQSNVKKLLIVFICIFFLILGGSNCLFRSVSNLYLESVQTRLEERAIQYKNSYLFKVNADLQTLQTMAYMLEDTTTQNTTPETMSKRMSDLWEASRMAEFARLCYFNMNGEGIQLSSQGESLNLHSKEEPIEMQSAIEQALQGTPILAHAFYDTNLGYNTIGYAAPIYSNGEVSGVLTCSVNTESYASILSSISAISDIGAVALLSRTGEVLASTRTHQTQGFYELEGSTYLGRNLYDRFMQALSGEETQFFEFDLNGVPLYACVMPIDICSDKIVIVDTDKGISDAVSEVVDYAYLIGTLFAVTSILFVLLVFFINRRHNRQLLQVAYHDRLTGAYNRYKFFQILDQRRKKHGAYTVAAINIRKFKYINELLGSDRSDRLLKEICAVLKQCIEPREFFCRDTADTFLLCLNTSERDSVCKRLEAILEAVRASGKRVHPTYPISLYAGCASTEDCTDQNSNEELMSRVMLALGYAKQSQQGTISFYDPKIHEKEVLQNDIENRMEFAIDHEEFQMYLQPKMDLYQNSLVGAEALVRWMVDGKQVIYPDQFIPVFERNGFCIQLDYYMVEQACKQIRAWIDAGLSPVPISVNQTKLLLYEDDYVERICAITQRYGVPGRFITLEILEGLALENLEKVSVCVERLHTYGFRISMDDFGTGYASLTTLSQISIDELKLDRSFLLRADQSAEQNSRKILEVVIEVAKRLHISTVAEGIETEDHASLMREMRCDYGQGYYYSRPISVTEFTDRYLRAVDSKSR